MHENISPHPVAGSDKMTLLKWFAPSRLYKKRDKIFFQTTFALVFLIGAILLILNQFLLIGVVLALAFVTYGLATVPPEEVEYRITIKGFMVFGSVNRWEEFSEFWFDEKWGQKILVLKKKTGVPNRVMALLGSQDSTQVKEKVNEYLMFREYPEKLWVDTFAGWLHKRFPFDKA